MKPLEIFETGIKFIYLRGFWVLLYGKKTKFDDNSDEKYVNFKFCIILHGTENLIFETFNTTLS